MPEHGSSPNLDILRQETGCGWQHLADASKRSEDLRSKIQNAAVSLSLVPADCTLILYGSVARGECTGRSDCDWTLLADGMAMGDHHSSVVAIGKELDRLKVTEPGSTGVFGGLASSHDLVHQIGGQEDTNQNTTRRILLLLESVAVGSERSVLIRARVVRQVLQRYLESEPSLVSPEGNARFPRFLLNDVVRYWRTMAVDYAQKVRDRNAKGWALRSIKLRLSRKLTFSSGMLSCFDCVLLPGSSHGHENLAGHSDKQRIFVQNHLFESVNSTPIEIIAKAVKDYTLDDTVRIDLAKKLFGSYDEFIGILDDSTFRTHLEDLPPDSADTDAKFRQARDIGKRFQEGLLTLFYEVNDELGDATRHYGVF